MCGIRLSHIFEISSISNEKPSILIDIPSILILDIIEIIDISNQKF